VTWTSPGFWHVPQRRQGLHHDAAVTVLALAVSSNAVVLGADELHVDVLARPPATSVVTKVHAGNRVIGGFAGVATSDHGNPLQDLALAFNQDSIAAAIDDFTARTQPYLHGAYQQWRTVVGPDAPAAAFGTCLFAGELGPHLRVIEVQCQEEHGQVRWTTSEPFGPDGADTYIAVYGAAPQVTWRRTSHWRLHTHLSALRGEHMPPPLGQPLPATIGVAALRRHVEQVVAEAIAHEAEIERPDWYPASAPVLAGDPRLTWVGR
jgi:hypothetical protein